MLLCGTVRYGIIGIEAIHGMRRYSIFAIPSVSDIYIYRSLVDRYIFVLYYNDIYFEVNIISNRKNTKMLSISDVEYLCYYCSIESFNGTEK
jgi:hypothetical protein